MEKRCSEIWTIGLDANALFWIGLVKFRLDLDSKFQIWINFELDLGLNQTYTPSIAAQTIAYNSSWGNILIFTKCQGVVYVMELQIMEQHGTISHQTA